MLLVDVVGLAWQRVVQVQGLKYMSYFWKSTQHRSYKQGCCKWLKKTGYFGCALKLVSLVSALIMQGGEEMGIYALKGGCMFVCATISFLCHGTCVAKKQQCLSCNKALKIYIQYPIFPSWRYSAKFVKAYIETSKPRLAIGEYWSTCKYVVGLMYVLDFDQGHCYWCWFW